MCSSQRVLGVTQAAQPFISAQYHLQATPAAELHINAHGPQIDNKQKLRSVISVPVLSRAKIARAELFPVPKSHLRKMGDAYNLVTGRLRWAADAPQHPPHHRPQPRSDARVKLIQNEHRGAERTALLCAAAGPKRLCCTGVSGANAVSTGGQQLKWSCTFCLPMSALRRPY